MSHQVEIFNWRYQGTTTGGTYFCMSWNGTQNICEYLDKPMVAPIVWYKVVPPSYELVYCPDKYESPQP